MRSLSLFIFMLLLFGGGFAVLNWSAFTQPVTLSFAFTQLQAPLGLMMLSLLALVAVYFLLLLASSQSQAALAARRSAKELAELRERSDQAEASRLADLRALIEAGLRQQDERRQEAVTTLLARIDRLDAELRDALKLGENSLAAHLGEIDDRIERGFSGNPSPEGR